MAAVVQLAGSLAASAASSGASLRRVPASTQQPRRCGGALRVRAEATDTSSVALNPSIQKDSPKVTDTVVVGDLSKPMTAYCRCWRSGTFPLCDGSHAKYNKSTGDNVGPLLLKK